MEIVVVPDKAGEHDVHTAETITDPEELAAVNRVAA